MIGRFVCGCGCGLPVKGIYCTRARESRILSEELAREEKSRRMKELWANNREGMLAAIQAGRAPAEEEA